MNPFLIKVLSIALILVLIAQTISIIDITKSTLKRNNKTFWIIMVLLFNIFGAIPYFMIGKKKN